MALFITRTAGDAIAGMPDSVQEKVRATGKWVYSHHDDAPLTPVEGFAGRLSCLLATSDGLFHLTFDSRDFPPNLYIVGIAAAE